MSIRILFILLPGLWLWACTQPEPQQEDAPVVLISQDMPADARNASMDQGTEMRDMAPVIQLDLGDRADLDMITIPDQDDAMADLTTPDEGMREDLEPTAPTYEDLGTKSVRDLFAQVQPAAASASTPLRMFYSAELDVYVGLDERTGWGMDEVEATFGALHTFRDALPIAYTRLFELSRTGDTSFLRRPQQAGWTNLNSVAAFVLLSDTFQGNSATVMASNFYALGPQNGGTYQNIPFLNIRPEVIEGRYTTAGPQLVYPMLTTQEARDHYLREGLADSLIHERIHGYISQFYGHDVLFSALRGGGLGCEHDLEELLVKRTLDAIYATDDTLFSATHRDYWARDRDLLAARIEPTSCYQHYQAQGLLDGPLFRLD